MGALSAAAERAPGAQALIFDHSALCALFPSHNYSLTLFEPIAIAVDGAKRRQAILQVGLVSGAERRI